MKSVNVVIEDKAIRLGGPLVEWFCKISVVDDKEIEMELETKWMLRRIPISERGENTSRSTFRDVWEVLEVTVEGEANCGGERFTHEAAAVRPNSLAANFCLPLTIWREIDRAGEIDYGELSSWIPFANDRGVFLHRFIGLGGKIKGLKLLEEDDLGYRLYNCDGYNILEMRCASPDPETREYPRYYHAVPQTCVSIQEALDWMYFEGFYNIVRGKTDIPYKAT